MKQTRFAFLLTGPLLLACQGVVTAPPTQIADTPAPVGGTSAAGTGTTTVPGSGGTGGTNAGDTGATGGTASGSGGSGGTSTASGGSSAAGGATTDISGTGPFCDLQVLLRNKCWACHSSPPALRSVPMALVSYGDLMAPAPSDPQKSAIEMSMERMQDTAAPMPPAPAAPATADDLAVVQAWMDAGMPQTCDSGAAGASGAGGDGGVVVTNPYDTPVTCTSNTNWTGGNRESPNMHPGGECISCHSSGEGPRFALAGTVYPSAHEPDDCNGLNGPPDGAQVIVTDANGMEFTMNVNSVGNFSYEPSRGATVALPYRAKVVRNGLERVMSATQTSGDCNSCHTESGSNDAPGRIMAP